VDHPRLLVGLERADDAGVYQLTDDLALIQTVDFFTPIVDEPLLFGQIAAANALSDVYAMGGQPICAMNIVAFPIKTLDIGVLREVLRGGLEKVREAGAVLVGGHSIDDPELKYGLSVAGTVHPDRIWTNLGARPGDRLILTKPLGTGVVSSALKRGKASAAAVEQIVASMVALNRRAAEILAEQAEVHACTDVTGFGLLGHACEMVQDSEVGLVLASDQVPLFPEALGYVAQGLKPGGLGRNREYRSPMVEVDAGVPPERVDLLYDPQTSGGLLAAVPADQAPAVVARMQAEGIAAAAVVGEVCDQPGRVSVR
jgi:selenide,water dikinase